MLKNQIINMNSKVLYDDDNITLEELVNGEYRVTMFKNNHWHGDIVFNKDRVVCNDLDDVEIPDDEIIDNTPQSNVSNKTKSLSSYRNCEVNRWDPVYMLPIDITEILQYLYCIPKKNCNVYINMDRSGGKVYIKPINDYYMTVNPETGEIENIIKNTPEYYDAISLYDVIQDIKDETTDISRAYNEFITKGFRFFYMYAHGYTNNNCIRIEHPEEKYPNCEYDLKTKFVKIDDGGY